jgi:retinol dehydrogenase-13
MSLCKKTIKWFNKLKITSLENKTVLVTGANSGIGYKTCETIIYLGGNVIMACRNLQKAERAKNQLLAEYNNAKIEILEVDLSSFSSIDNFVKEVENKKIDVDAFINNAGIYHQPGQKTNEGFEKVIGTNYFGVYYLSEKILPYLKTLNHKVYYVNTISMVHKIGNVDFDDFYFNNYYSNLKVYARSKLCLAKYSYYLAQKYKDTNICVLMNHPGIAITPIALNAYGNKIYRLIPLAKYLFNTAEKSSLSVALILSRNFSCGSIIGPNKIFGGWGYPKPNHIYKKVQVGENELIEFTKKEIERSNKLSY